MVGWSYWAWKYYKDPTGSADEALVMSGGRLRSTARVIAQTYPEAIAGVPVSISFDYATGAFDFVYTPNHRVRAPTVIVVPTAIHYPHGYCVHLTGAKVISRAGSELLRLSDLASASSVHLSLSAGQCPS